MLCVFESTEGPRKGDEFLTPHGTSLIRWVSFRQASTETCFTLDASSFTPTGETPTGNT